MEDDMLNPFCDLPGKFFRALAIEHTLNAYLGWAVEAEWLALLCTPR